MTKRFLDWVVGHRWLVISLFCIITFLGLYSWRQLPIDAYPDIADVTVQVVTQVPGLAAEEIEQQINNLFRSTHLTFIDQIALYKNDEIVGVYKRNKK